MNEQKQERQQIFYAWLAQIPTGQVVTYGQLAKLAGLGNAARWVGRELGRLPEGSSLPWHRVLNHAGRISLPAGPTRDEQIQRLLAEGVIVCNGRVSLADFQWQP